MSRLRRRATIARNGITQILETARMVVKAKTGELNLDRTLWALRRAGSDGAGRAAIDAKRLPDGGYYTLGRGPTR